MREREKILCVDDNPNILAAYKRRLRKRFHIETAQSGEQGLEVLSSKGPFAVVVADVRMPGMDGIQFLAKVKELSPDSVRMILTGYADLQTAIDAVNTGNIFRFLVKPCPPETFAKALNAGIEQYQLIKSKQKLLKEALTASVKILMEILNMVKPAAFRRTSRIVKLVKHITDQLQLPNSWQFELAAMLSQIGCVVLPAEILNKVWAGIPLSEVEQRRFDSHPLIGYKLLANIPRLEAIARMIKGQRKSFGIYIKVEEGLTEEDIIGLGAQILKVSLDFDQMIAAGLSHKDALSEMYRREDEYNPQVVKALENLEMDEEVDREKSFKKVGMDDLEVGMITYKDIRAKDGSLLVSEGQEITYLILERLRNFSETVGVIEPFRVQVKSEKSDS